MNNIQKSIKDLRTKFKSSKNIKKNLFQKNFFTVESTPRKKSKIKTIIHTKQKTTLKSPINKSKNINNINNMSIKSTKAEKNNNKTIEFNEKEKINKNCDNKSKNEAEIINNKLDLNNIKDNLKISINHTILFK